MKRATVAGLTVAFVILTALVIIIVFMISNHFLTKDSQATQSNAVQCQQKGTAHKVTIQNNAATPKHTHGKLCDTLIITNQDNQILLMAFGQHDNHQPYDGITEQQLSQGQSLTVTLNQTGTYEFHDHIGDVIQGDFTVTK